MQNTSNRRVNLPFFKNVSCFREGGDAVAKDEEKPPAEEGEGQAEEPATDEPAQEKQGGKNT